MPPPLPAGQSVISISTSPTSQVTRYNVPENEITHIERQSISLRRKGDLRSLGEIKHIPRRGRHLLARLIGNLKLALQDNLHLIVGIGIHQWGPFLQAIESARDRLFGIILVTMQL